MGIPKTRYIITALMSLSFLSHDIIGREPFTAILILPLIIILYLIGRVEKSKDKSELSGSEKFGIIVTSLLFNFYAMGFYYFCLKNVDTKKSKQAIKYSFISALALIIPLTIIITTNDLRKFVF